MQPSRIVKALFELDGTAPPDLVKGLSKECRRHLFHVAVEQAIMEVLILAGFTTPQAISLMVEGKLMAIATDETMLRDAMESALIMPYEEESHGEETGQEEPESPGSN